jgi:hypothetical protein
VDFAKAKSIAARRKQGYFPLDNPKNAVFRRAISDRPYVWKKRKSPTFRSGLVDGMALGPQDSSANEN